MLTKEEALRKIEVLVKKFDKHKESYKKVDYKEMQTRRDFIDPFWKALGWDVDNENCHAEGYREVIQEASVIIDGKKKAPDYLFSLSGLKKLFYLEVKKPSIDIKTHIDSAYQIRRYGWTSKLAISIISDFEEFAIYDCTKKPKQTDSASNARIKYITYSDYIKEFDFIWDTFSRECVPQGNFDNFTQNDKNKKGTTTVDQDFLVSLDKWREKLAADIAQNKNITENELTFVVQNTLNRIIFLRIAEDRGAERYGDLQNAMKSGDCYKNLLQLFYNADKKYNSGLFDFNKDTISPKISIYKGTIKSIIHELYYPICPYEFSVMSVEILGNAYEHFLGKRIKLSPGKKAIIEEKPEVRKAGGVYYTPQYVVNYIVKNTVGKLIENKTPDEVCDIKIVDPACGSGSFLIGAFQYLLNWHKDYYASVGGHTHLVTPQGELTSAEKKRILINNIFGVDLDSNAVEVAKLSLLLKCMEGETQETIEAQSKLYNERLLPSLENNIKSGNSLVDLDYFDKDYEIGDELNIRPFSWQKAFREVFQQGGFDCVIGNPPYLRMQGMQETQPNSIPYFRDKYESAKAGNYDLYVLFNEVSYKLLNPKGIMGLIQPHKFMQADFGEGIRNFIAKNRALTKVVNFGSEQVFTGATTYTCLLFLSKREMNEVEITLVDDLETFKNENKARETFFVEQPEENHKWNFASQSKSLLLEKLKKQNNTLYDIVRKIFQGIATSADKIFVLQIVEDKTNSYLVYSKSLEREIEIEKGLVKPFLMGKDIKRYEPLTPKNIVIFPYLISNGKADLMSIDFIKENYPLGYEYLLENKKELECREHGKFKKTWWQFSRPQNMTEFEAVKISTPDIANFPKFTLDIAGNLYHTTTVYSFVFNKNIKENEKYFLGVFNSKLLWYFLSVTGNVLRGGFFRFKTEYLKPFPIKLIDFNDKAEKQKHDEIVKHVDSLLQLNKDIQAATLPNQIEQIQTKIGYCEDKINEIVYGLYGLTEEEVKIVEK